jgi:hypothetical protein
VEVYDPASRRDCRIQTESFFSVRLLIYSSAYPWKYLLPGCCYGKRAYCTVAYQRTSASVLCYSGFQAVLIEPLASNQLPLWLRYSGFQASCLNIVLQSNTFVLSFMWAYLGRAIAQAISRWLPTAAARVRARVWSCEICGGQSGAGAGFLRVLRLPLPIFILPTAPQSPSSIIWGLYNRPDVAAVPGGLCPTPLRTHYCL